jgi:hypothetical protein
MVDQDYKGEPLAQLTGTVSSSLTNAPEGIAAAIVWEPQVAEIDIHTFTNTKRYLERATLVDVEGEFPTSFTLTLFEPPPEDRFEPLGIPANEAGDGVWMAKGRIIAVDRAHIVENGDGTVDLSAALLGSTDRIDEQFEATNFELWYLDRAFEDDPLGQYTGMSAGYHLMRMGPLPVACAVPTFYSDAATCHDVLRAEYLDRYGEALSETFLAKFCNSPLQTIREEAPPEQYWVDVPLDTPLTMSLVDGPTYTVPYGYQDIPNAGFVPATAGIYPESALPACN